MLLDAGGGRVKAVEGGAWGGAEPGATLHHKQIRLLLSNALAWVGLLTPGQKAFHTFLCPLEKVFFNMQTRRLCHALHTKTNLFPDYW